MSGKYKTATEAALEKEGNEILKRAFSPKEVDNWQNMNTFMCETCQNYINFRCRCHSPNGQEGWPAVYPTDWCGDHKMSKTTMQGRL